MQQAGGIRSKITFWFFLLLAFMVGISAITYGIVSKVEEKLFNVEEVDSFLENTLELRRMEKNFLLYGDHNSLAQGAAYLTTLARQLTDNEELFIRLSSKHEISEVRDALRAYAVTFAGLQDIGLRDETAAMIRNQGNQLTILAEDLVVRERQAIHRLLRLISNTLLMTLPLLVVLFSSAAALLGQGIVSSLKKVEKHAAMIATGNFMEAPFSSSNREVNGLITAFNKMSRELKSRQQQLVRSEKLASLGTMLAGVAHELNNPLSNISSSSQILAEEIAGEKGALATELLDQITAETSRASAIVKTLLALARHENFHRDHYLLKPLVQETISLFQGQIGKEVDIHLAMAAELAIFGDKQKLQQVFLNLLKNSVDALAGRGIIQIKAWQNEAGLKIVMSDDGPGVPPQIKEKIFDPFFTTKDTGQGSGLGLFIVHDIIVQHGGSINVDNRDDQGAAFTIHLPAKENA